MLDFCLGTRLVLVTLAAVFVLPVLSLYVFPYLSASTSYFLSVSLVGILLSATGSERSPSHHTRA